MNTERGWWTVQYYSKVDAAIVLVIVPPTSLKTGLFECTLHLL